MAVKVAHDLAQMPLMSCVPRVMATRDGKMSMSVLLSQICVKMAAAGIPLGHSPAVAIRDMHWMRMVLSAWVRCL